LPFADPQTLAEATVAAGYRVHAGRYLCPACGADSVIVQPITEEYPS
jgi:transposase-like protein